MELKKYFTFARHFFWVVRKLLEFTIPFKGLSFGVHTYDFTVDKKFFEFFEYSEISSADLKVKLKLERQSSHMVLDFKIKGEIKTSCDRCLEDLMLPLKIKDTLIIKIGEEIPDTVYVGEEVPFISHHDTEINIAQFVYEFIVINLPPRKIHREDKDGNSGCNKDMLERLNEYLAPEPSESDYDPRWEALKKIIDKN